MTKIEEKIDKVADIFAEREAEIGEIDRDALYKGFYHGAEWALSHQWVSVDDALPKIDKEVLFLCEYGKFIGYLDGGNIWFANGLGEVFDVTYWMPIPPLP